MTERDIKGMNTSGLSHADLLLVEAGINSAITELELSVLEIRYSSGTLRITLDADPTPDLEIITEASRMISELLDSELAEQVAELRQKYELEVSSPGLERPLFKSEHFRRFAGRLIEVKSRDANGSRSRIQGVIVSSDSLGVELIIEGSKDKRRFDFKSIDSAKTVFVWPEEKKTNNSKPTKAAKKAANDARRKGVAISPAAKLDDGFDDEADDDLLSAEDQAFGIDSGSLSLDDALEDSVDEFEDEFEDFDDDFDEDIDDDDVEGDDGFDDEADDDLLSAEDQAFGIDSGSLSLDDDDLDGEFEDELESGDEFAKLVRTDGQDRHFDDEDLADLEDEVLRRQKELEGNSDVPKGPFG